MKKLIFLMLLIVLSSFVYAQECPPEHRPVDLVVFYGKGCPHCAQEESFLEGLEEKHSELNVTRYEIYFDQENILE